MRPYLIRPTMQMDAINKNQFPYSKDYDGGPTAPMKDPHWIRRARFDYLYAYRLDSYQPCGSERSGKLHQRPFCSKYSKHGSRVKNASGAQDAHEAIRPSSVFNTPPEASLSTWTKTSSSSIPLFGTVL